MASIKITGNISSQLRPFQLLLNKYLKEVGVPVALDSLESAYKKVDDKAHQIYRLETSGKRGLRRISKFLGTKIERTEKTVNLNMSVDANNANGFDNEGKSNDVWNAIAHQTEFGVLRDGSNMIVASKARVLALPIHEKAIGWSPRAFPGRWNRAKSGKLFFFSRGEILYLGVPQVSVRPKIQYFENTVTKLEEEWPKIILQEMKKDFGDAVRVRK